MNTRTGQLAVLTLLALAVAPVGSPAATDGILPLVPASADAVVCVNVPQFTQLESVKSALASEQCKALRAQLEIVTAITGIDLLKDITRVYHFRKVDAGPTAGSIAIEGKFDEALLVRRLEANPDYQTTRVGSLTVHGFRDDKTKQSKCVLFPSPGVGVLSNSYEEMLEIIAAKDDPAKSFLRKPGSGKLIPEGADTAAAWISLPSPERPTPTDPAAGKLHITNVLGVANVATQSVSLRCTVHFDSAEHAAEGVKVVEGFVALGRLQDKDSTLKSLATRASVQAGEDGKSVVVGVSADTAEILSMLTAKVCQRP
jgi:hypothetical protein